MKNVTLPLLLAAVFSLSITEGLMFSNMKRPSSPGYSDLWTKQKERIYKLTSISTCVLTSNNFHNTKLDAKNIFLYIIYVDEVCVKDKLLLSSEY